MKNIGDSNIIISIIGLVAGIIISAIDNYAFDGEVSPIVIVLLLFVSSAGFGAILGMRGSMTSVVAWAVLRLTHLGKHLLKLHETLNPNTYASIMKLTNSGERLI